MQRTRFKVRFIGKLAALFLATALMSGSVAAFPEGVPLKTSADKDWTDLWWNPSEPGWGMQMTHTGNYIYATIYVYGADGKPTWFAGGLDLVSTVSYQGNLYAGTGPYFGGPFNPASVSIRQVGTMKFIGYDINTALFTYSVDGVVVEKLIQRQPLTLDNYNGTFAAIYSVTSFNCLDPASDGAKTDNITVQIIQNQTAMTQVWKFTDGTVCTFDGGYSQSGRMGLFSSDYYCNTGETGVHATAAMTNTGSKFMARFEAISSNRGCSKLGNVVGLIPQ